MRNIVNNVIGSNDIVGGIVRALVVVAKRHVEMLQDSLRHLHLAMRRGPSAPGSWLFSLLNLQPAKLQPAYAAVSGRSDPMFAFAPWPHALAFRQWYKARRP